MTTTAKPQKSDEQILQEIKSKGANLLKLDFAVTVHNGNQINIKFQQDITRSGNTKQGNHIVPVAMFLSGLQVNLEHQTDIRHILSNLEYIYHFDDTNYVLNPEHVKTLELSEVLLRPRDSVTHQYVSNVESSKFEAVRKYFDKQVVAAPMNDAVLHFTLEKYIIPLIYDNWNSREHAIYQLKKKSKEYGSEGPRVKNLKEDFMQLYNNKASKDRELCRNWSTLQDQLNQFIQAFIQNIDLPRGQDSITLFNTIDDIKIYVGIAVNTILNSKQYDFVHDDNRLVIKPEIQQWYDSIFHPKLSDLQSVEKSAQEFGNQLIRQLYQDAQVQLEYNGHITKHIAAQDAAEQQMLEAIQQSCSNQAVPRTPENTKIITYKSNEIKRILENADSSIKIQILLNTGMLAQQDSTNLLISTINQYIEQDEAAKQEHKSKNYLVIDLVSADKSDKYNAYLAKLTYSQKRTEWKLSLVQISISYNALQQKSEQITSSIPTILLRMLDPEKYSIKDISDANLAQIVEYAKLRLTLPYEIITQDNVVAYQDAVKNINQIPIEEYKVLHTQQACLTSHYLIKTPNSAISSSSGSDYIPPDQKPSEASKGVNQDSDSPFSSSSRSSQASEREVSVNISPKLQKISIAASSSLEENTKMRGFYSPNPFSVQHNIEAKTPERTKDVKQVNYYSPQPSTSGIQQPCKRSSENLASKSKKIMTEPQSQCQIQSLDNKNLDTDRNNQYDVFESATANGDYTYWLQQHDLPDIARVHYHYKVGAADESQDLEVIGALAQLSDTLNDYLNHRTSSTFTIIINIDENGKAGNHWVSLVLHRIDNEYHAYYADSLRNSINSNIDSNIEHILNNHEILVHDVSITGQQTNDYDCGLWALENGHTISNWLMTNNDANISSSLPILSTQQSFQNLRNDILNELRGDMIRQEHLYGNGGILAANDIIYNNIQYVNAATQMIAMCVWTHTKYNIPSNRHKRSISGTDDETLTINGQDFLNCTSKLNRAVLGVHFLMLDKLYKNIITDVISCNQMNQVILATYITLYNKLYGVNTEILHSKLIDTLICIA